MSRERRKRERQAQQNASRPINWKYQGEQAEKKSRLKLYYKIAGGFTIVAALLFLAIRVLHSKGYFMINTTIEIWIKYAMMLGALLIAGRYFSDLPKAGMGRKVAKVVVSLATICLIFVGYIMGITQIDAGYLKVGTYASPDGRHEVVVLRSNKQDINVENSPVNTYYVAFPKINALFCGGAEYAAIGYEDIENIIWLVDDADAPTNVSWDETGGVFTLSVDGNTIDFVYSDDTRRPMNTVTVTFD